MNRLYCSSCSDTQFRNYSLLLVGSTTLLSYGAYWLCSYLSEKSDLPVFGTYFSDSKQFKKVPSITALIMGIISGTSSAYIGGHATYILFQRTKSPLLSKTYSFAVSMLLLSVNVLVPVNALFVDD